MACGDKHIFERKLARRFQSNPMRRLAPKTPENPGVSPGFKAWFRQGFEANPATAEAEAKGVAARLARLPIRRAEIGKRARDAQLVGSAAGAVSRRLQYQIHASFPLIQSATKFVL
ncbi:hypothetical protein FJ959_00230 [Mesorhizobium sp. B2-2-4]|nr:MULTISPECIES: hypothetical protein [unclassified Mesorhizobium]TPM63288.1 hypothetical protein FJ965_20665 [Mesorhizobium sp. B2-2-1]TPM63386.1 hypothetical protein FJ959_00230 [Mesorhizobium sp. B2-2-4]TPN67595.1 hypothetical protein FJ984_13415 [Mesorhizobium sp. B1-1-3]